MQLTSKGANMVVDFYPVKFADGEISTRYILKTVTFMGKSQSKSYILKRDFDREVTSRVEGYGYEVTDMHTSPQLLILLCVLPVEFMSLIKQHLFDSMNQTDFICAYFGKDWTITTVGFW